MLASHFVATIIFVAIVPVRRCGDQQKKNKYGGTVYLSRCAQKNDRMPSHKAEGRATSLAQEPTCLHEEHQCMPENQRYRSIEQQSPFPNQETPYGNLRSTKSVKQINRVHALHTLKKEHARASKIHIGMNKIVHQEPIPKLTRTVQTIEDVHSQMQQEAANIHSEKQRDPFRNQQSPLPIEFNLPWFRRDGCPSWWVGRDGGHIRFGFGVLCGFHAVFFFLVLFFRPFFLSCLFFPVFCPVSWISVSSFQLSSSQFSSSQFSIFAFSSFHVFSFVFFIFPLFYLAVFQFSSSRFLFFQLSSFQFSRFRVFSFRIFTFSSFPCFLAFFKCPSC